MSVFEQGERVEFFRRGEWRRARVKAAVPARNGRKGSVAYDLLVDGVVVENALVRVAAKKVRLRERIIPGHHTGTPVFGAECPPDQRGCNVATDVYCYLLDEDGEQTNYIRRVRGRPVEDIARDLQEVVSADGFEDYEWATLGQAYKYGHYGKEGLSPNTECPQHDGCVVYVTHGGSEGHLVHVNVRVCEDDRAATQHFTIFMVKTLSGLDAALEIQKRLAVALGVW